MPRRPALAALAAALLALAGCAWTPAPAPRVALRIVALNDFHGHLEPPASGITVPESSRGEPAKRIAAGGIAHVATAIQDLKRGQPHAIVVGAGDLVGASPVASSLARDEPAVATLTAAGLELSSVGNHEFDRGRDELKRLQEGGCDGPRTCLAGEYRGAGFRWLAANVVDAATGRPFFPAYEIKRYDGIAVAFVGLVLRGTPGIVSAAGIRGLEFRDESATVNALVPELRRQGAEAIVVLIHEGGRLNGAWDDPACPKFSGDLVPIVKRFDRAVDVVVSGHTHDAYVCRVDGRLVTSAGSYGRLLTAIDVTLDRASGDVVEASARNLVVEPSKYPADERVAALVARAVEAAAPLARRVVGRLQGELSELQDANGESSLGAAVAQAQLAAMREAGAQAAIMNPGGLRAPIRGGPEGEVTYGALFEAQPFGNTLVAMTLTGAQLLEILEGQLRGDPDRPRLMQFAGLAFDWDGSRPRGERLVRASVRIAGEPLDPAKSYRIAANSFLADGGDGQRGLSRGTLRQGGPLDVDAFEAWFAAGPKVAAVPGAVRRIDRR